MREGWGGNGGVAAARAMWVAACGGLGYIVEAGGRGDIVRLARVHMGRALLVCANRELAAAITT